MQLLQQAGHHHQILQPRDAVRPMRMREWRNIQGQIRRDENERHQYHANGLRLQRQLQRFNQQQRSYWLQHAQQAPQWTTRNLNYQQMQPTVGAMYNGHNMQMPYPPFRPMMNGMAAREAMYGESTVSISDLSPSS